MYYQLHRIDLSITECLLSGKGLCADLLILGIFRYFFIFREIKTFSWTCFGTQKFGNLKHFSLL